VNVADVAVDDVGVQLEPALKQYVPGPDAADTVKVLPLQTDRGAEIATGGKVGYCTTFIWRESKELVATE